MRYLVDSRKLKEGDVYLCLPGGEKYIQDALSRGASDVLSMSREEMAFFANEIYGYPSRNLTVIGVTGTNGKTTVTNLVASVLAKVGCAPHVLGTLNSELTTPEAIDIQFLMSEHLKKGGTHFVMEVSSHAITQGRILGIDFDVKLLTNITQDHLDYHKTVEAYKKTKLDFMSGGKEAIYPEDYQQEQLSFIPQLLGEFNHKNLQAAQAILKRCGISNSVISEFLAKAQAPPGRFEVINEGQKFKVIVDYAHTPDGLENILNTVRQMLYHSNGKIILVFGCGGDRDRLKRPKMGHIATTISDYVILTQDNPRTEDQEQIIHDIVSGIACNTAKYETINDREEAIRKAINIAGDEDFVVIAGKGHETYQIFTQETVDFDDRQKAKEAIRRKLDGYFH